MCGGRAVPYSLALEAHAEVVAPKADRRALPCHPALVLDFQPLTSEFDVEAAGCLHVEGQHLIVDVPSQRRRHRHLTTKRAVQAQPDVVGLPDLDHEMDDPAWRLAGHERQAVVTRVDP